MHHKGADDDVRLRSRIGEDVPSQPVGLTGRQACFCISLARDLGCERLEVDAGEVNREMFAVRPAADDTQGVAVAKADIEDLQRPGGGWSVRERAREELQCWRIGAGEAIDLREVFQTGAKLLVASRLVHKFMELRGISSLRKIDVWGKTEPGGEPFKQHGSASSPP